MDICVIDGSNLVVIRVYYRVRMFFVPLETRSEHGAENEQPVLRRGEKKLITHPDCKIPPRFSSGHSPKHLAP